MQQAEDHVLHVYLIGDGLQEPKSYPGTVKPSYRLRVSFLGEIPPARLAALLHVLHHLELFLHKADVETEGLHHLAVKDTPGNLGEIRQVPDRSSVHAHGTIGFRTVAEIPRIRRGGVGFLCFRLRNGTGIQRFVRTIKAIFLLLTVNRIIIRTGSILLYRLFLRSETVLAGGFELFLQFYILPFQGFTRFAFFLKKGLQIIQFFQHLVRAG